MSNRLTSAWTETLEEAFGQTGRQGTAGELIVCRILDDLGLSYKYCPNDKTSQIKGIDLYIDKDGIDVKANLHKSNQTVAVEYPRLMKSKARWWWHVDLNNPDYYIIYEVRDMIDYINKHKIKKVGIDKLCWVNQKTAKSI